MKKTTQTIISVLLMILILASGCASIVSKSSYPVNISSQPEQAEIKITDEKGNTVYKGNTPTMVTLDAGAGFFKGKDYSVTFSKQGYDDMSAVIRRGVDNWYIFGNIAVGGIIGWLIVDPATGAMWTLEDLSVTLKEKASSRLSEPSLNIVHIDNVPKNYVDKMVRIK